MITFIHVSYYLKRLSTRTVSGIHDPYNYVSKNTFDFSEYDFSSTINSGEIIFVDSFLGAWSTVNPCAALLFVCFILTQLQAAKEVSQTRGLQLKGKC